MRIFRFDEIDSTSDFLKNKKDKKNMDLVISKKQTKGRGQWDRKWYSEEGGAWFTLAMELEKNEDMDKYKKFTLEIAEMIILVLKKVVKLDYKIKYPNDIYVNEKKLAGILVEKVDDYLYIGIGINVNIGEIGEFDDIATSLYKETGNFYDIEGIVFGVVEEIRKTIKKKKVTNCTNKHELKEKNISEK